MNLKNYSNEMKRHQNKADGASFRGVQRKYIYAIIATIIVAITGGLFYYDYNYGKVPIVSFDDTIVEKYTELSYEDILEKFNVEYSENDIVRLKENEEVKEFESVVMDSDKELIIISEYRKRKVENVYTLKVQDTIKPVIKVIYDTEIEPGVTIENFEEDYSKENFEVIAVDRRNGKDIPIEFDYAEGASFPENEDVKPGDYPIIISANDGENNVDFQFTLVLIEKPQEEVESLKITNEITPRINSNNKKTNHKVSTPKSTESSNDSGSSLKKPYIDSGLSNSLFTATNNLRVKKGITPYQKSDTATALAKDRVVTLNKLDYLSHDGAPSGYGENLFYENTYKTGHINGAYIAQEFYNSPVHKNNMLNTNYKEMGTAVIVSEEWSEEYKVILTTYIAIQLFK